MRLVFFGDEPFGDEILQSTKIFKPQCFLIPAGLLFQAVGYATFQDNDDFIRTSFAITILRKPSGNVDATIVVTLYDPINGNLGTSSITFIDIPQASVLFCNDCEDTPQVIYPTNAIAAQQAPQITVTITKDGNMTTRTIQ